MLFSHLLPHLVEHLKKLVLMLLRQLHTSSWFLRRGGVGVLGGVRLIICELGGRAPYGVGGFVPGGDSVANGCLSLWGQLSLGEAF